MIVLIPFFMVPVAFWMHRDNSSNLGAISAFILIYSFSLVPHLLLENTEFIFIINIITAAALTSAVKIACSKESLLIVLILLTCFVLTILNAILFIAYNYYKDTVFQVALQLSSVFVGLQWAALWVKDDRLINGTRLHNHISRYLLDRAGILLRRAKI